MIMHENPDVQQRPFLISCFVSYEFTDKWLFTVLNIDLFNERYLYT